MPYPRRIFAQLAAMIPTREITVITGMRQVGKTTLCKMLFESIESDNKVFLDIENPVEQEIFQEKDYNNIWANLRHYGITPDREAYIFIDEIQAMPQVVMAIKYLFDHYRVKFFLTGSSGFYLKNLFPESLAGRKVIFELFPLDFEEFLLFKGINRPATPEFSARDRNKNALAFEKLKKFHDEYVNFGGFPEVVLRADESQKKMILGDILKSYYEKEVRTLADFTNARAFRELMHLMLARAGGKLDITKLSSEVGVSRTTIYSYLSFLEGTYFISLVSPLARSADREVSGTKKVYLCDNGLVANFARVDEGNLLENAVYHDLRKYGELRYYQKRSGAEIDFLLTDKMIALEVKRKGSESDRRKLSLVAASLGYKESYIISREFVKGEGFIPATDL
jgi:predicted AAA+ superfamily ATPase